ncbi:MAG: hypothetical protein ACE5GY_07740 [Thermodesulfobacteriota bacterium]
MADEKEIRIVIRAKDEFSGVLEKAREAARGSGEAIREAYSGASVSAQAKEAGRYASALEKIAGFEAARASASGTGVKSMDAGLRTEGLSVEDVHAAHAAKLASHRAYNAAVVQEASRSVRSRTQIESIYTEFTKEQAAQRRDFMINAAAYSAGAAANAMQNLFVATGSKHRAMFETMKAFAIAQTVIDTYKGATAAYAALAGIPVVGPALATAAAASAIAAGLARVQQIRATNPGGGSISAHGTANPAYSGGSFDSQPVPTRLTADSRPTQNVTIQIYNPLSTQNWSEIVESNIIPALNDAADRNISVSVRNM